MREIFCVTLVAAIAIALSSIGDRTEFERTERMEQVVSNLRIQDALDRQREKQNE